LKAWLEAASITAGAVFRPMDRHGRVSERALTGAVVALIVKKCASAVGLDCSTFSGHSLRAGHVTAAVKGGASEHSIQKQTGHRSVAMLRTYIRDAELFTDNSAARLGL
jgi:integrase